MSNVGDKLREAVKRGISNGQIDSAESFTEICNAVREFNKRLEQAARVRRCGDIDCVWGHEGGIGGSARCKNDCDNPERIKSELINIAREMGLTDNE